MHYQSQFPVAATSRTRPVSCVSHLPQLSPSRFQIPACPPVTKIIYSTWCRGRRTPNFSAEKRERGRAGRPLPCGSLSVKLFKRKPLRMLTLSFTFYLFCHLINFLPGVVVPDLHTNPMESVDMGGWVLDRGGWRWHLEMDASFVSGRRSVVSSPRYLLTGAVSPISQRRTKGIGVGGFSGALW